MKLGDLINNLNETEWENKLEKPIAEYSAKELMKMAKTENNPKYTMIRMMQSLGDTKRFAGNREAAKKAAKILDDLKPLLKKEGW